MRSCVLVLCGTALIIAATFTGDDQVAGAGASLITCGFAGMIISALGDD